MSSSTSIRRLSTASKDQEDLINAYEAEEERLLNVLSRKLEQLREEKINLENVLEAESESHVNRLTRELTALRLAQQNGPASEPGGASLGTVPNLNPDTELVLDFLRRENEQLRSRLVGIERDYARVTRLNEIYREELIEHRNRAGIPVDNLIGLHRDPPRPTATPSMAIPRPSSRIHRPEPSDLTPSSSSLESPPPFPLSPLSPTSLHSQNNATSVSTSLTSITSPSTTPGSGAFGVPIPVLNGGTGRGLTYPSNPPPSLSSSFGSPVVSYRDHRQPPSREDASLSPVVSPLSSPIEPLSRHNSHHRRRSYERRGSGGRVAETGSLLERGRGRSRAGSGAAGHAYGQGYGLPTTIEGT